MKGSMSEQDICVLLHRYSMNTVLRFLQEVEQCAGEKIDWRELAKNSATGISGAREYQMLWRHIAYGEPLVDQLDDNAEPIDDDSDLEHELEAFPAIGREASGEAAACVKVLIDSGYPNNTKLPNDSTIEAPMTINIPNSKSVSASSDGSLLPNITQGRYINIAVSLQSQSPPSGVTGKKRPNNEVSDMNLPKRRRQKTWSLEEDMKLTASVQKHGERNWANIARWEFKDERTSKELSKRWSNLRKSTKAGTSSQPSETVVAARRVMSLAVNMPIGDNWKSAARINAAGIKIQPQPPKSSASLADQQLQMAGATKPQILINRNSISERDSMVKAAAVAAGARIATPADASSLIEAVQSQHAVHIMTGVGSAMKPSTTSVGHQLPSNVHFIRNGLSKAPISTFSGEAKPAQSRPSSAVLNPMGSVPVSNATSAKENAADNEKIELPQSNQAASSGNVLKENILLPYMN